MDYSPEKAAEIISEFNLSPTTNKVWKTRGSIPDKYASGEPIPGRNVPSSMADRMAYKSLLNVLSSPKIKTKALFEIIGTNYSKYKDAVRPNKTVPLDANVIKRLQVEISKIRVGFRNFFDKVGDRDNLTPEERKRLDELLTDPRISTQSIMGKNADKFRHRIYARMSGKSTLSESSETAYARERVAILLLETQL